MLPENVFRWITLLLLLIGYSIGGYFRARARREGGELETSGNWLVVVLRLLGLLVVWPLLVYLINPAWVAWAQWGVPGWLRWTAVGVAALTIPAIYWLFSAIGKNITPSHAIRDDHQLVTSGPYRWIRHPLYTFGFTFYLAISLVTALWWLTLGLLVPLAVIVWRTRREEQNLIEEFGDEYRAYMRRTGRYFPRLRRG